MGVTGAQVIVDPIALEASVRDVLNITASRHMVVLDPLKITISNFPHEKSIKVTVFNFPNDPDKGKHEIDFDEIVYIETSDFKEVCSIILIQLYGLIIFFIILLKMLYIYRKQKKILDV